MFALISECHPQQSSWILMESNTYRQAWAAAGALRAMTALRLRSSFPQPGLAVLWKWEVLDHTLDLLSFLFKARLACRMAFGWITLVMVLRKCHLSRVIPISAHLPAETSSPHCPTSRSISILFWIPYRYSGVEFESAPQSATTCGQALGVKRGQ